jgi:hypothetical protein
MLLWGAYLYHDGVRPDLADGFPNEIRAELGNVGRAYEIHALTCEEGPRE